MAVLWRSPTSERTGPTVQRDDTAKMPAVALDARHVLARCPGPDVNCQARSCIHESRSTSFCGELKIAAPSVDLVERDRRDSTCLSNEVAKSHKAVSRVSLLYHRLLSICTFQRSRSEMFKSSDQLIGLCIHALLADEISPVPVCDRQPPHALGLWFWIWWCSGLWIWCFGCFLQQDV